MKKILLLAIFSLWGTGGFAQTATKEQIVSDLPELEITEEINLHIISPEPIQYVDLSTQKLTGDLPSTNIARIKINDSSSDSVENNEKATKNVVPSFSIGEKYKVSVNKGFFEGYFLTEPMNKIND